MNYKVKGGYNVYGEIIGILLNEAICPRIIGDMGNAMTFNFPVKYKIVKGATVERVVEKTDPKLLYPFIKAAQELEKEGVKAITTSCGFLSIFQEEISAATNIPVFTSSLIQVPLVYRMLGKDKKVGIITAYKSKLTEKHLRAVGIDENIPVCIIGMENSQEFYNVIIKQKSIMDVKKVEAEVVINARLLVEQNNDIGAIVFECTNLPPYAAAVQRAVHLPVFDIITLTNMIYNAVVRKEYPVYFQ